jgi:hypothetical protein
MGFLRGLFAPRARPSAEPGGMPFAALYPTLPGELRTRSYQSLRSVPASTSTVILAPANPARRSLAIVNDSSADLYIAEGPIASSSSYSLHLSPGQTGVLEDPDVYQGDVAGVWTAAAGAARVTEST